MIAFLNELVTIDKTAIDALLNNRVPCNEALAEHPTVQVVAIPNGNYVGMFGIINGLFGVNRQGFGRIRSVFEDGELIRFERND